MEHLLRGHQQQLTNSCLLAAVVDEGLENASQMRPTQLTRSAGADDADVDESFNNDARLRSRLM